MSTNKVPEDVLRCQTIQACPIGTSRLDTIRQEEQGQNKPRYYRKARVVSPSRAITNKRSEQIKGALNVQGRTCLRRKSFCTRFTGRWGQQRRTHFNAVVDARFGSVGRRPLAKSMPSEATSTGGTKGGRVSHLRLLPSATPGSPPSTRGTADVAVQNAEIWWADGS